MDTLTSTAPATSHGQLPLTGPGCAGGTCTSASTVTACGHDDLIDHLVHALARAHGRRPAVERIAWGLPPLADARA